MMRFTKFLKVEASFVIARHTLISDETKANVEPVVFLNPEFAKKSGIKENDVVEIEREGKTVKLRVKYLEEAPEDGGLIPNGVFANYISDLNKFKKFKAQIQVAEDDPTSLEEILAKFKS